ncbi:hypothetical protein P7K49_008765 [Saguinus oedipus]|uniref:Uncharacterized protein n=1 Tax=Saguinus oedipus TaxID=9490 RepID=A0ABQ9VYP1_SAGOE|nr:hypothetical protein P7K49_008765 [Saguinus oedipus]
MDEMKELYFTLDETFYQISKVEPEMEVNHRVLHELCVVLMKSAIMEANKVLVKQQLLELSLILQPLRVTTLTSSSMSRSASARSSTLTWRSSRRVTGTPRTLEETQEAWNPVPAVQFLGCPAGGLLASLSGEEVMKEKLEEAQTSCSCL